jgi:hypothetical protein
MCIVNRAVNGQGSGQKIDAHRCPDPARKVGLEGTVFFCDQMAHQMQTKRDIKSLIMRRLFWADTQTLPNFSRLMSSNQGHHEMDFEVASASNIRGLSVMKSRLHTEVAPKMLMMLPDYQFMEKCHHLTKLL